LRSIKQYVVEFWRMNIYLFWFKTLWKEVWHSVYVEYSDFYYEIFMLGKRGVTLYMWHLHMGWTLCHVTGVNDFYLFIYLFCFHHLLPSTSSLSLTPPSSIFIKKIQKKIKKQQQSTTSPSSHYYTSTTIDNNNIT